MSQDIRGAAFLAAVKNVISLGCGMAEGAGLGLNAAACLFGLGLQQAMAFAVDHLGAQPETLFLPCGLADAHLSCMGQTRNYQAGKVFGQHPDSAPDEVVAILSRLRGGPCTVEGLATAENLAVMAETLSVPTPSFFAMILQILRRDLSPVALADLIHATH